MFSFPAKVVCSRFVPDEKDEQGQPIPDLESHAKINRGHRNLPVLLPNGTQAVNEDGTPKVTRFELAHVHVKPDMGNAFHFEIPYDQLVDFPIGKDVTITIG